MLALALLSGCDAQRRQAQPDPPAPQKDTAELFESIDSPGMQFLPRLQEAPGWVLQGDPLVYPAKNLAGYLDSDAANFTRYEVVDSTVGRYEHPATRGFATVEIFRFPDFVKAFGAYSNRREGVVNYLDIENESFAGKRSIHVWRGPFYFRIVGGPGQATYDAMRVLATTVAARMPVATGKPAVFNFLPENFRSIHSERFDAGPVLGQPYLAGAFMATYVVDGTEIEGMILPAANKAAATRILDQYKAFFVTNGRLLDPVANLGEDNFTGEDRTYGRVSAMRLDRFVIAFRGFGDKQKLVGLAIQTDQRILGSIRKQLVTADKRREQAAERRARGVEEPAPQTSPIPSTVTTP